ncbi:MAG: hypothetical protein EOP48_12460 [Sphingobacteriales bacterium]|nr:MAG: hypothetical protein EOP48_12460 [Sphingobacteriales bacterium]
MSQNLKSKLKNQTQEREGDQQTKTQSSNDQHSTDVRMLTIEEQLECFADLLIDLYLLDQQLNDHED